MVLVCVCGEGGVVKRKGLPGTEENTLSTHYKEPFLDGFKPAECQNYHNRNRLTKTVRPRYGTADGQNNGLMPEMTMPGREQCIDGVFCPPVPVRTSLNPLSVRPPNQEIATCFRFPLAPSSVLVPAIRQQVSTAEYQNFADWFEIVISSQ